MISRRLLLSSAAALGAVPFPDLLLAAPVNPTLGKEYTAVRPALEFPKSPVVIHDFFAYTCPHCLSFAPLMEQYTLSKKSDPNVKIVPVPVAWTDDLSIFPRVYYAFEAKGLIEKLHMNFWTWAIREEHDWKTLEDIEKDVLGWVKAHGEDPDKFRELLGSFSVVSKYHQATRMWKNYGVDATPCIGVDGRWITAPHLAGTRQGAIDVTEWLVKKALEEK